MRLRRLPNCQPATYDLCCCPVCVVFLCALQVLYVGAGCPNDVASFQCIYGNDDLINGVVQQSNIILNNWQLKVFYVMATSWQASQVGTQFVNVAYTLPSITPTSSTTGTPSPTATLSTGSTPTQTSTSTPSASLTATPTPSVDYTVDPSDSATVTPTVSTTASPTSSLSQGVTGTSTNTATVSVSPTNTASVTPTNSPICGRQIALKRTFTGFTNSSGNVTITASDPLLFSSVTCGINVPLGPKAVFAIDLSGMPLGQRLTITTVSWCSDSPEDHSPVVAHDNPSLVAHAHLLNPLRCPLLIVDIFFPAVRLARANQCVRWLRLPHHLRHLPMRGRHGRSRVHRPLRVVNRPRLLQLRLSAGYPGGDAAHRLRVGDEHRWIDGRR